MTHTGIKSPMWLFAAADTHEQPAGPEFFQSSRWGASSGDVKQTKHRQGKDIWIAGQNAEQTLGTIARATRTASNRFKFSSLTSLSSLSSLPHAEHGGE